MDRENFAARQTHIDNLWRMVAFCENKTDCRRGLQLSYFGEHFDRKVCRANARTTCDNCESRVNLNPPANLLIPDIDFFLRSFLGGIRSD